MRCPKGTPIAAMRYLLNQPTIKTHHKCAQVREYIQVSNYKSHSYIQVSNYKSHSLHKELSAFKGKRIKRRNRGWPKQRIQSNLSAIHKK
jgi:hypothetical protein